MLGRLFSGLSAGIFYRRGNRGDARFRRDDERSTATLVAVALNIGGLALREPAR